MSPQPVKLIVAADSGMGKTGGLASLASQLKLNLRILDLDNNVQVLRNALTHPQSPYVKSDPQVAQRLQSVISLSEPRGVRGGKLGILKAEVWLRASDQIAEWKDGDRNFGAITTWTPQDVLVVDTFTRLSSAAMNFHLGLNGRLNQKPTLYDYGDAQNLLGYFLEIISDDAVKCNVVLNCHIDRGKDGDSGLPMEACMSVGEKLGPKIPTFFGTLLKIEKVRKNNEILRVYKTQPTGLLPVKTSSPFGVQAEYPLETGLADYFKAVRGA